MIKMKTKNWLIYLSLDLLKWKIMLIILGNGNMVRDMEEANRYGAMDLNMKVIGKTILPMEEGD